MRRTEAWFLAIFLVCAGLALFLDARIAPAKPEDPKLGQTRFVSGGWYCPVPAGEGVQGVMSTANLGRRSIKLRRSAVGEGNESAVSKTSDLAARRSAQVAVGDFQIANAVGLTETFGAATATDLLVLANPGVASSRCSSGPGETWLFASGSTTRRQDYFLLVANPFEEEAVIKVRMMAPDKEAIPARLGDLVIPPLSQMPVSLSEFITETPSFGLEVQATQGRVIVSRYAQLATREGIRGASLDIGVSSTSRNWLFAGGDVPGEGEELINVINPGTREALVQLTFQTDSEQIAPPGLEELAVSPGRQTTIKVSDFLPRGTRHSTRLASTNGIGVVAERQTAVAAGSEKGFETVFGVPEAASRWAVRVGTPGGTNTLAILNSGRKGARATVTLLTERAELRPKELSGISIAPDRRYSVDLTGFLEGAPATALVQALPGEVAVEGRLSVGAPHSDFSSTRGRPISD